LQDVILVSNCCGDCCGFAPKGSPWQVHVQTAGSSVGNGGRAGAELVVMCLQSPEEFRSQVLAAKRRLADPAAAAAHAPRTGASAGAASGVSIGAGKDGGAGSIELRSGSGGGGDSAAVVAVLERIERALNEGIALAAARSGGAGVAGAGGAPASYGGGGVALSGLGGVYPSSGAGR
jgi:predicted amino acid dehydrogenase